MHVYALRKSRVARGAANLFIGLSIFGPAACKRPLSQIKSVGIQFAQRDVELGIVTQSKNLRCSVQLNNPGMLLVRIKDISPSCRCTSVKSFSPEILPGKNMVVEVSIDTRNQVGEFVVSLLASDTAKSPHLWIEGSAGFHFNPPELQFGYLAPDTNKSLFVEVVGKKNLIAEVTPKTYSDLVQVDKLKKATRRLGVEAQTYKITVTAKGSDQEVFKRVDFCGSGIRESLPISWRVAIPQLVVPRQIFLGELKYKASGTREILVHDSIANTLVFNEANAVIAKTDQIRDGYRVCNFTVTNVLGRAGFVLQDYHIKDNLTGNVSATLSVGYESTGDQ